jgi:hypothetical protein
MAVVLPSQRAPALSFSVNLSLITGSGEVRLSPCQLVHQPPIFLYSTCQSYFEDENFIARGSDPWRGVTNR